MSMTYVTIALTGQHTAKGVSDMLAPMMRTARQAFGIVAHKNKQPNSRKELPHAFAEFSTDPVCANDSSWNEPAVGTKTRKRPNLCEIRTLRLPMPHLAEQMESDA